MFHIRHLLLVKLMTASFDINFQHEEEFLDFSGLQLFLDEISKLKMPSIGEMLQHAFPKVVSSVQDPTVEVDRELQSAIEALLFDIIKDLPSDGKEISASTEAHLKQFSDKARLYIPDEFCDSLLFVSLSV